MLFLIIVIALSAFCIFSIRKEITSAAANVDDVMRCKTKKIRAELFIRIL